jgi:hypothetical protein
VTDIDGASEQEWQSAVEGVEIDLNDFEAYAWPIFRDRGYSKDAAVVCWWLNMIAVGLRKFMEEDDEDEEE